MAKLIIEQLTELSEAYVQRFPEEDDPRSHIQALGSDRIIEVLKEAGDRLIVFEEGQGDDQIISISFSNA